MAKNELVMMGATLALDLVRFALTARNLEGKTPDQVLAMWRLTSAESKAVGTAWDAMEKAPEPVPDV